MPKRISKPQRKTPLLFPATVTPMAEFIEQILAIAEPLKQRQRGNITTGPERTPLGLMTAEQVEAYKRQRLKKVLRKK